MHAPGWHAGQVHMPEQRLDIHELGPGLEEPGRISVAELVGRDLLVEDEFVFAKEAGAIE